MKLNSIETEEESIETEEESIETEGETVETYEITDYDYEAVQNILCQNQAENAGLAKEEALGNILLTGTNGFLGIHVLKAFLDFLEGKVYAMVRRGGYASPERRLKSKLLYYFGDSYDELFGERIVCIDADLIEEKSLEKLKRYPFRTVVNCAANAGQIMYDSSWQGINVDGTRNLIAFCKEMGRRLIHISTVSVAGEGRNDSPGRDKALGENELYIGQRMPNEFIRTKFLAERYVLEAAGSGLDAKIIRVGNVMSRESDGEFQINSITNGFLRRIRGYAAVGMFPMDAMNESVEFSPVDSTAEAILRLAGTDKRFTVYHACNSHRISMEDLVNAMKNHGFDIQIVEDAQFGQELKEYAATLEEGDIAAGVPKDGEEGYTIKYQNQFTTEVLQNLGFQWPVTDERYLGNVIDALDRLGFFE